MDVSLTYRGDASGSPAGKASPVAYMGTATPSPIPVRLGIIYDTPKVSGNRGHDRSVAAFSWRHATPREGCMPQVLINCPETGRPVYTGMSYDWFSFDAAVLVEPSFKCPQCGHTHSWKKTDAYLRADGGEG
jgi:endogenous inhibitor of DNA gyrase (YacG/DUF329 family)